MSVSKPENKDLPAFASTAISGNDSYHQDGLTKREYFAAMAMQGMLSDSFFISKQANWLDNYKHVSNKAVGFADALLKELESDK